MIPKFDSDLNQALYVGEKQLAAIRKVDLDKLDVEAVKNMTTSPFTQEEWLQQAMDYYVTKHF
ncbi:MULTISPECIES: hypothetical protein [Clostridia]|uniref:hypothetical protein n=1 Tax=Clostridia TaxID=186801 RepID=UPI000EA3DF16|nr:MULTISPECIES: hypothetical protein [Clostridia]NBJ68164.1 hypothetical protein [Roseburia sp. 1XD42-34]RKI81937.1 hypothetical protein D7V87_01550 [Clostridium sp. 1xD42-85]